ncbi:hypothetical protein SPHINGO361_120583 [Sphingomonas sp. EC-HK361]|nr:hypothetical protein SPHINGO361_120583 [Sphingomonas sp. EC-HK361]
MPREPRSSADRLQDGTNRRLVRGTVARDVDRRGRVERIAHGGEIAQHDQWIAPAQQWARVAPGDAVGQHLGRGIEPDRQCLGKNERAGFVVDERAATGRDDLWHAVHQPRDHAALAITEIGFVEAVENLGDGHARRRLDLVIGIDEGKPEARREPAADRRLADAHQPDEHDRLAGPGGGWGGAALQHRVRGYTAQQRRGKSRRQVGADNFCARVVFYAMSRLIVSLVVIVVVVVGGLFLLGSRATEKPQTRVEQTVELGNLAS